MSIYSGCFISVVLKLSLPAYLHYRSFLLRCLLTKQEARNPEWREMEGKVVSSRFKRVCVFCGSSVGKRNCYRDAAIEIAQELVFSSSILMIHETELTPFLWVILHLFCYLSTLYEVFRACACKGIKEAGPCVWRWEYWTNGAGFTSCASWWGKSSWVQSLDYIFEVNFYCSFSHGLKFFLFFGFCFIGSSRGL